MSYFSYKQILNQIMLYISLEENCISFAAMLNPPSSVPPGINKFRTQDPNQPILSINKTSPDPYPHPQIRQCSRFLQQKSQEVNRSILSHQQIIELLKMYHSEVEAYKENPSPSKEAIRRQQELVREISFINKVKKNNETILKDRIKYLQAQVWGKRHEKMELKEVNNEIELGVVKIKLEQKESQNAVLERQNEKLTKQLNAVKFLLEKTQIQFKIKAQVLKEENVELSKKLHLRDSDSKEAQRIAEINFEQKLKTMLQTPKITNQFGVSCLPQSKETAIQCLLVMEKQKSDAQVQCEAEKRETAQAQIQTDKVRILDQGREEQTSHALKSLREEIQVLEKSNSTLRSQMMGMSEYMDEAEEKQRRETSELRRQITCIRKEYNKKQFAAKSAFFQERYSTSSIKLDRSRRSVKKESREKSIDIDTTSINDERSPLKR